mgnify:CR=1 FL=1
MGSVLSKPKAPGVSAEQKKLAKQQSDQLEQQKKDLAAQEAQSTLEAEKQRKQRISSQSASQRRASGRSSLIKTGSELGTQGSLG